jgi:hypothetical protein
MTTIGSILIGKIIFYYIVDLAQKGMKYFQGKPNYKKEVKSILDSIADNKNVIEDISKMIDPKKGIDNNTAESIVNMGYIKTQIIKMVDSTNGELDETELKNQLKTILIKSWTPMSSVAIEKVKKDLK